MHLSFDDVGYSPDDSSNVNYFLICGSCVVWFMWNKQNNGANATHGPSAVQKMFPDRTEAMLDRRGPGQGPGPKLTLAYEHVHATDMHTSDATHCTNGTVWNRTKNNYWNNHKTRWISTVNQWLICLCLWPWCLNAWPSKSQSASLTVCGLFVNLTFDLLNSKSNLCSQLQVSYKLAEITTSG